MFLWPLCRVWNTNTLLCARYQDMETGQEEEEEEEEDISFMLPLVLMDVGVPFLLKLFVGTHWYRGL